MRRDNLNLLSASKTKAVMMALLFLGIAVVFTMASVGPSCVAPFYVCAFAYGCRWFYCWTRDTKAAADAQLAREQASQPTLEAPKTTPRRGLYIPNDND